MAFSGGGEGEFIFSSNAAWDEDNLDEIARGLIPDGDDNDEYDNGDMEFDGEEGKVQCEPTLVEREMREYDQTHYGDFYGTSAHATWRDLQLDPRDGGAEQFQWPTDWYRPRVPALVNNAPSSGRTDFRLVFQNTDIDYTMVDYENGVDDILRPEIRLYGTTGDGNSICARVRGFFPYFYVRADPFCDLSSSKEYDVALLAKVTIENYLRMDKSQQESYRVSSMHTIPALYVAHLLRKVALGCVQALEAEDETKTYKAWADNFKNIHGSLSDLMEQIEESDGHGCYRTRYTSFLSATDRYPEKEDEIHPLICCPHFKLLHQQDDPHITRCTPISYIHHVLWEQQGIPDDDGEGINVHRFLSRKGCGVLLPQSSLERNRKTARYFYTFMENPPFPSATRKLPLDVKREWVLVRCLECQQLLILAEGFMEATRLLMKQLLYGGEGGKEKDMGTVDDQKKASRAVVDSTTAFVGRVRNGIHDPVMQFAEGCKNELELFLEFQNLTEQEKQAFLVPGHDRPTFQYVKDVRIESDHRSVYGGEELDTSFLRVELFSPRNCTTLRTAIHFAGLLLNIVHHNKVYTSWMETYESNILFTLRYMVDAGIVGMGWVVLMDNHFHVIPTTSKRRASKCQIEVLVPDWSGGSICGKVAERDGDEWGLMAKIRGLWLDIEVAGQERTFPIPSQRGAVISNIGVSVFEEGTEEVIESCVLCLGGAEPMLRRVSPDDELTDADLKMYKGTRVYTFGSEQDLLLVLRRMFEVVDPDFVGGYNIKDFDMPFMVERSMNHALGERLSPAFRKLGRLIEDYVPEEKDLQTKKVHGGYWKGLSSVREEVFSSRGTGTRRNKNVPMPGRIAFDALTMVKANHKLRSYKLDNVARAFLDLWKRPISYPEVTQHAIGYYDIHRTRVNDYVKTDDMLPKLIAIDTKTYHLTYTEQARVCGIPMSFLLSMGQTIKILAKFLRHNKRLRDELRSLRSDGEDSIYSFLIPYRKRCMVEVNEGKMDSHTQKLHDKQPTSSGPYEPRESSATKRKVAYEGATVIKPLRGFYDDPVPTLDFRALYPSIMLAFNLCYSTHIMGKSKEQLIAEGKLCAWDYRSIAEGGDYRVPVGGKERKGDFIVTPSGQCFWKDHIKKGILPEILKDVLATRKGQKQKMKLYEDGTMEQARHNAAQLALKLVANSLYGYTGCDAGLKDIGTSESVTAFGRYLLEYTRDYVRELGEEDVTYANDCLYGDTDSVMVRLQTIARIVVKKYGNWDSYEKHPLGTPIPQSSEWEEGVEWLEMADMWEAAKRGKWLAEKATALFQSHGHWSIVLEFEKVYERFLLQNKKKYSVRKWEEDQKTGKLKPKSSSSGLENIRRDQFLYTKNTINGIDKRMVDQGDINAAFQYAYEQMVRLINGEVPMEDLVLTNNFTKRPDLYAIPNVAIECAKRSMRRDPGTAPTVGSRIPYIMVMRTNDKVKEKKIRAYEKSEDPEYVKRSNLPVDYDWYTNRFMGPLCRFFAPAVAPKMEQKDAEAYTQHAIFRKRLDYLSEQRSRRNSTLIKMFEKKQAEIDGEESMDVEQSPSSFPHTPSANDSWIFAPGLYSFDTIYTECTDPKEAITELGKRTALICATEKKRRRDEQQQQQQQQRKRKKVHTRKNGAEEVSCGHLPCTPSSEDVCITTTTTMEAFFSE